MRQVRWHTVSGQEDKDWISEQCSGVVDQFRRAREGRTFPNAPVMVTE